MARTRKLQSAETIETAEAGIKEIINTSVEKTFEEAATYVNVANFKLRDMFSERLGNDEPQAWETVPTVYEPLLEEFKRQMDAAGTVKPHELSPVQEPEAEIPLIEEEPAGKLERTKAPSTDLTKGRKEAMERTKSGSKKTSKSVQDAILLSKAQKGRKRGAKKATVELLAEEETYLETMTNAAYQQLADEIRETADESSFDPYFYIRQAGSQDVDETLKNAVEKITPVLDLLGKSTDEIVDNSYSNGSNLDLSQLLNLMQSGS
ncbi:MAG TPA: hypothetical protein V6D48_15265 [Oculatellaceae cyanobacterium]